MYDLALPYFDQALDLAKKTPDSGYPLITYEAQLHTLVGLRRYEDAQQLVDRMLKESSSKYRSGAQAQTLFFAAQIALARGDVPRAVGDLEQSIAICKAEGYQQLRADPETLAELIARALSQEMFSTTLTALLTLRRTCLRSGQGRATVFRCLHPMELRPARS